MDIADSCPVQIWHDSLCILDGSSAGNEFICRNAIADNKVFTTLFADILNNFQGKTDTVLKWAAILVGALIGIW